MAYRIKIASAVVLGIALIPVATLLTHCKPAPDNSTNNGDSNLSTLDNLASNGALNPNHCGPEKSLINVKDLKWVTVPAELENDVGAALSAVPQVLRDTFARELGGRLIVDTAQANSQCAAYRNPNSSAKDASFVTEKGRSNFIACPAIQGRPDLYIAADKATIRHTMIRLFSYVYSVYVVEAERLSSIEAVRNDYQLQIAKMDKLRNQFIIDLNAEKLSGHAALPVNDPNFSRIVFAEALDSYYCSLSSSQKFRQDFPNTLTAFETAPMRADDYPYAQIFGRPWFLAASTGIR